MRAIKNKKGFTLVELSLSLVFVGILSLTIAYIINDTIASYRKGVTLKQINTVGMGLVDDMRAAIQNSSTKSVKNDCEVVYGNIYKNPNSDKACKDDGGQKFVSVTKTASVVGKSGKDTISNVPVYGAFCVGDYSYIWNSGYFFNDDAGAYKVQGVNPAVFKYEDGEMSGFRLLKVKDDSRSVCITAAGENYGDLSGTFTVSNSNKLVNEGPVDLLASDEESGGLALYDLYVAAPAESTKRNNLLYSVSFILGTVQGGVNIMKTGGSCATPDDYEIENFDYCAINKFNFAAQAIGG